MEKLISTEWLTGTMFGSGFNWFCTNFVSVLNWIQALITFFMLLRWAWRLNIVRLILGLDEHDDDDDENDNA